MGEVDADIAMNCLAEMLPFRVGFAKHFSQTLVKNRIKPAIVSGLVDHRAKRSVG